MLATISTHKRIYKYNCLPFSATTAPALFQQIMESLLQDVPCICVYLDDILVMGKSQADHLKNLSDVLTRLENASMRLKKNKCVFMMSVVEYLGHKITKDRLQPAEPKVEAVTQAPSPQWS